jgi:hypothetical protein
MTYNALKPNQIKSATDNNGNFDKADNDIRFQRISPTGFYSTVEKSLESIKQEKGTPEQFKAMLLKNGGKQAKLDWMGWDDFASGKKSVTKNDIQNWIDENRIDIVRKCRK